MGATPFGEEGESRK